MRMSILKKYILPPKVEKKRIQSTNIVKQVTTSYDKQKKSATLGAYFMSRTTPGAQKSLQNCWQRKEAVERCDLALAKWMIDACVPFNVIECVLSACHKCYNNYGSWLLRTKLVCYSLLLLVKSG